MGKQKEAVTLEDQNKNTAMRVSVVSIVWNVVLSLFKLIAGIVGHSGAIDFRCSTFCLRCVQYLCGDFGSEYCQSSV